MAKRPIKLAIPLLLLLPLCVSASVALQQASTQRLKTTPRIVKAANETDVAVLGAAAVTVISNSLTNTDAAFWGQLTSADKASAGGTLPNTPAVNILTRIRAASGDIGALGEVLFVASYNNVWYMKTPQGWLPWNQQLSDLVAVGTYTLTTGTNFEVETQLTLPGDFNIYVGYRLGGVVHYSLNPLSFRLVESQVDMSVSQFIAPPAANNGDVVTLTATVSNNGRLPATTVLRFYQSDDASITPDDIEICTDSILALEPSANSQQGCTTTIPPQSTYYYGGCIDPIANEANAANNCSAVASMKVGPPIGGTSHPPINDVPPPTLSGLSPCVSPQILDNGLCVMPNSLPLLTHRVNDTGVTRCVTDGQNNVACPVGDFPGQDAELGRDLTHNDNSDGQAGFSFTKISATGQVLTATTPQWPCVKDNVTGLIWEVKTDDNGLHDQDWTYSWYEQNPSKNGGFTGTQNGGACGQTSQCDTAAYVQAVNAAGWCGAKDWRMPTLDELEGIVALDRVNPSIDTTYFPNTPAIWYWAGSAAGVSDYAWYVYYTQGMYSWNPKSKAGLVRLVRGG